MSECATKRPARLYGVGEERMNAITHGVGALLGVWGTIALLIRGAARQSAIAIVAASLYGASLILLYTVSCLYHALTAPAAKKVFRVLDHCTIFFLILGTYIPIALVMIGGPLGWWLFAINTACAVLGITLTAVNMEKWKKVSMALYIAMGWLVVIGLGTAFQKLSPMALALLFAGGVAYTAGITFYRRKGKPWSHAIWHLFVLAGSVCHFAMIYISYRL